MYAVRVLYSGRVQGVGFRATATLTAREFLVTGWVRNLHDGSVELWGEGEVEEVQSFLAALHSRLTGYIQSEEQREETPSGRFRSFDVVR